MELFRTAEVKTDKIKSEISFLREKNRELVKKNMALNKAIDILNGKLALAMAVVEQPGRQPPGLSIILNGFSKTLTTLQTLVDNQLSDQIDETFRVGEDTLRLAPLYTWKSIKKNGDELVSYGKK